MKITIIQMERALNAFNALTGTYESVTKLANGEEKTINRKYLLGEARYHVRKNMTILTRELDEFSKVRQDIIDEMAPEGNPKLIDDNPVLLTKFRRRIDEERRRVRDIPGLLQFKLSLLNVGDDTEANIKAGKNPIPEDVLVALEPFIIDDSPLPADLQ